MEKTLASNAPVRERTIKGRIEIDIVKCKGCELCAQACKENVITLSSELNIKGYRYMIANNDNCTGCVNCALVCPDAVITVYRTSPKKKKTVVAVPDIREQLQAMVNTDK